MSYPSALSDLINSFKKLPGIGEKSAERYALSILDIKGEDVENFAASMIDCKNNLHPCAICGHITDKEICDICSNSGRNKNVICILEDYKSVFAFEKAGNYNGVYHVLDGLISPIDDINPEDIESFSILKDDSDIKEYGEEGKNGVILVTLKKGVKDYSRNYGYNKNSYRKGSYGKSNYRKQTYQYGNTEETETPVEKTEE